jgi:hypothetical protein
VGRPRSCRKHVAAFRPLHVDEAALRVGARPLGHRRDASAITGFVAAAKKTRIWEREPKVRNIP